MEGRVADDLPHMEEVIIKEEVRDWELEEPLLEDCSSVSLESQQRSEVLKNYEELKEEIENSAPLQGKVGTTDSMVAAGGLPDDRPFQACPYCNQVTSISQLESHIADCHPGRKRYPCSHCPKIFRHCTSLKKHLRKLKRKNHLTCTFCKQKYITAKSLRKHVQAYHPGRELYPCLVCKRVYQRQSDFDDHSKTHSKTSLSTCTVCRKNFCNKRMFLRHLNNHLTCRTDTTGSTRKPNQEVNSGQVEPEDNTEVIEIKEESLHSAQLDKSEAMLPSITADESQVSRKKLQRKCPYCDEEYNCPDRMETHIACYHPGKKRLPCFQCTKVFRRQIDLQEHSRIHKGEHRLKCPVCNRSFSAAGALRRHVQYFHPSQKLFSCSSCHRVFSQKNHLEEHAKLHQKDSKCICPICNQEFTKRDALTRHMATHAVKTPHSCPHCKKGFMFKRYLVQHMHIHSANNRYTCQICKGTFANMATLQRHKQTHTGIKPHSCCICSKSFRQRCHLVAHILIVHCKDMAHSCTRCGDKFQLPNYLKKHASCHVTGPFKCYECSKVFSHPSTLALHIQTHSKEGRGRPPKKPKPESQKRSEDIPTLVHDNPQSVSEMESNPENVMDEGTARSQCFVERVEDGNTKPEEREWKPDELQADELMSSDLKSELGPKVIDNDPEFREEDVGQTFAIGNDGLVSSDSVETSISKNQRKCPYCEEVFDNPSDIESHIVCCHPGQKRHPCFLCVAVFRRQVDLYEHYRTHSGNSRLRCPLCNKYFCSGTTLKAHVVALHPAQKTFSCSICRRVFANQSDADEHKKIHMKESVFKCPVCKKVVSTKENLMRHFASHSVTRPFCCSVCNKGFAYKISLDIHARCHSGSGPYTCSICSKSFTQKGTLNLHQLTHTGEKPHTCSKCGKSFRQRAHLIGHMLVHSGERPYACNQCGKAFQVRTALRKHAVTHSKGLLDCYNCNSNLAYPDSSIENMKNKVCTALQKHAGTHSEGLLGCYNFKDGNLDHSVMKSKQNEDSGYMACSELQSISTAECENDNQVESEIPGEMDEVVEGIMQPSRESQSDSFLYTEMKTEPYDEEQDEIKPMYNLVIEEGKEGEKRVSEDIPIDAVNRNLKMEDSHASDELQPRSDSVPEGEIGVNDGISGDSQHIEEVIVEPNLMNWSPEESHDDEYSNSEYKTEASSETIPATSPGSEIASRLYLALTSSSVPKPVSVAKSVDKEPVFASSEYLKNMSDSSEIKEVTLDSIDKDEDYLATSMSVGCELSNDKLQRKCPYCNDEFDCSSRMESHIVYHHPGMKQHVCFQCLRVFRRQIDLIEHFRVHKGESCYQCPICNRFFSATGTMKRHIKHFHPDQEIFTCSLCRSVFCSQSDLDEHKKCHQKEIVFTCPVCNENFNKQESMIKHFETHSKMQKTYCCVRCNLDFQDNDSLLGHMYKHSTEGLHICEICQKGFTKPASLKLHKLIHTGEKPHQCSECGKGFRQRAHLAGHMLIHSGERPYSCSQCGKTFQVRSKVKKHLLTHASQSHDSHKSSKSALHLSTPPSNYNAHSRDRKADGCGIESNSNARPEDEEKMNRAHDELNSISGKVSVGHKQEDAEISEDSIHYWSRQTDWKPEELLPDECVSTQLEPEHIEVKVEPKSLSETDGEMEEESIAEDSEEV